MSEEGSIGSLEKHTWADEANTLVALTNEPNTFSVDSIHMQKLERFVVIMYSEGFGEARVNDAMQRLLINKKKKFGESTTTLSSPIPGHKIY